MSDIQKQFKVGDLVTPNKEKLIAAKIGKSTSIYQSIGCVFTVVYVEPHGTITLDRKVKESTPGGWIPEFWQIAKNHIVTSILNDL